jgi:hypothetical protein
LKNTGPRHRRWLANDPLCADSAGQPHANAAASFRIAPSGGESYHAVFVSCTTGFRGGIGLEQGIFVHRVVPPIIDNTGLDRLFLREFTAACRVGNELGHVRYEKACVATLFIGATNDVRLK